MLAGGEHCGPSTPTPVTIDLNATSMAGGSSSGCRRKLQHEMPANMLIDACNLFDGIPAAVDDDTASCFLENMIFKGGASTTWFYSVDAYNPDETENQDDRAPFTQATNDQHDAFMQDQVGLDGFPLDHEFPKDYGLEEEDDMDIDREPLFEEELANQTAVGAKPKRKSKRTKAYMTSEDKLLCVHALEVLKVQHDGKPFHLFHCWTIINGEEKFKAQYAALLARRGKEVVEDHGDGEKAQPQGNTNSKKEDKRDAASIALLEKVEGMISKKDLRKEKRRLKKEEQINAFMEIQRRRLEMDAEKQAKMLEIEATMPRSRRMKWPLQA
ncbi:Phospholipid-transporting ATPase 1 [Hordeum vulgare]|nr:Phospholipid-transporting ATPase 1 [Hordeum vulgare]